MLVPLDPVHRDELVVETSGFGRGSPALLRAQREGVLLRTRDAPALRDVLARLAHRLEREQLRQPRIRKPPAELRVVLGLRFTEIRPRSHERRAAHRFDAAGDEELAVARGDCVRRGNDGGEPRRAEAVHRHARDGLRQPGQQHRHPRNVAVVLARLVRCAEVDVFDLIRRNAGTLDRGRDDSRREIVGPHTCERAAPAPDRRPDTGKNDRATHAPTNSTRTGCSYVPVSSARRRSSDTACRPSSP